MIDIHCCWCTYYNYKLSRHESMGVMIQDVAWVTLTCSCVLSIVGEIYPQELDFE